MEGQVADFYIDVPRVRDRDIFRFFQTVATLIGAKQVSIADMGARSASTIDIGDDGSISQDYFLKSDLFSIYSATVSNGNFSISLSRPITQANQASDLVNDKLYIHNDNNNGLKKEIYREINRLINDSFHYGPEPFVGLFHNQKTFTSLIKSHQQMLGQLQGTATNITEQLAAARLRLEEEFAERQSRSEEELQKRRAHDEELAEATRTQLLEKEQELEERRKNLDDRDNTTARRAQHATLKSRISERGSKFVITPETRRARLPIHAATIGACAVLIGFLIYYVTALSELPPSASTPLVVATAVKPIGLTVALLGLVAWYLRWMNRWFERHADAEFYLKQFELDIDRANWVVETALEWKEKQERTIPDTLLESISKNLFTKSEKDVDADMHPADYLASAILGRASNVNLKVPGGEISLAGKDIRRLQKDEAQAA
jgi:hypothetical protein